MVRSSRLHRLPQRLDYTLIPAPLDLTLPLVDEKSPLPAIIVTPSSPRNSVDFSIVFLAPEPKPSLRQRVASYLPRPSRFSRQPISLATTPTKTRFPSMSGPFKFRSILIMFLTFFVMACHMVAHRFAIMPRMDFETKGLGLGEVGLPDAHIHGLSQSQPSGPHVGRSSGWFGFLEVRGDDPSPDFPVAEPMHNLENLGNLEDPTDALPNLV